MSSYTIPTSGKATAILDTAERLFGQFGFEGLSMSTLAKEAGVSKANIFHHFKSKEELYMTVLHRARKRIVSQVLTLTHRHDDTRAQVHTLVQTYLRQMLENEPVVRLLLHELMEGQRSGERLAERIFADNISHLIELLREAQQKGALRQEIDPGMTMVIIAAVSLFYIQGSELLRHLAGMSWSEHPDKLADALWEILWHGIAPTTPPANRDGE